MTVGLVTYIPHQPIVGRIKDIVKSDGQFYNTETRCQMSGINCYLFNNITAQLVTQLWQLLFFEFSQVCRTVYLIEQ